MSDLRQLIFSDKKGIYMKYLSRLPKFFCFAAILTGGVSVGSGAIAGNITEVTASNAESAYGAGHSNIFQLGVSNAIVNPDGCDTTFAAINKDEIHLIDVALMAIDKNLDVELQVSQRRYFGNRCIITDIEVHF
jgi:hypothetical protein